MFLDQSFVVLFAIETLHDFYLTSPLDLPLLRQEKNESTDIGARSRQPQRAKHFHKAPTCLFNQSLKVLNLKKAVFLTVASIFGFLFKILFSIFVDLK